MAEAGLIERLIGLRDEIEAALADESYHTPLVRTPLSGISLSIAALEQGLATERALERS